MERLTDKNHNAINKCGEYSSCYSCHKEICYIKEIEDKLGELEDALEKYGIENAEELDGVLKPLIDNCELENWKSAIFWKTQTERLAQELADLQHLLEVAEKALDKMSEYAINDNDLYDLVSDFNIENGRYDEDHFGIDTCDVVDYFKLKADKELKGE